MFGGWRKGQRVVTSKGPLEPKAEMQHPEAQGKALLCAHESSVGLYGRLAATRQDWSPGMGTPSVWGVWEQTVYIFSLKTHSFSPTAIPCGFSCYLPGTLACWDHQPGGQRGQSGVIVWGSSTDVSPGVAGGSHWRWGCEIQKNWLQGHRWSLWETTERSQACIGQRVRNVPAEPPFHCCFCSGARTAQNLQGKFHGLKASRILLSPC